ncbi:MAG TPA: DMT family transporter [Erysipelotrichaceae bacterium]|nr:DMT family transporter [Erysipelotrichaceae bacterium]
MKKRKITALIVLFGVIVLWGIAPVVSKALFNDENPAYSPGALVGLRGLFSVIAMAIIINKGFKKIDRTYLIALPAGLILAAAYIFQFVGLKYTVPSKNTFLENVSCLIIPLFMFIFTKEKPTWANIISSIVCVIGSVFLIGKGFDLLNFFDEGTLLGDGFSVVGGIFFGLDVVFTKVFCKDKDPLIYVFLQLCVLTVVSFAYSFIFEGLVFHNFYLSLKITDLLLAMFLGVICTAVSWVARAWAIRYVSAVTASVMVPLSAIVATTLSIAFGMEEFNYNLLIGGAIVLISVSVSAIFDYYKDKEKLKKENLEEAHLP